MKKPKLAIASDHAGFSIKEKLKDYLKAEGYELRDFGTDSVESVDYPDFAHPLANAIERGDFELGITVCGSGNGIAIASNKHQGIRAAVCWNSEISRLARAHNNANVCALPGRFIGTEEAIVIIKRFLHTSFDGGRHNLRVKKIPVKSL